MGGSLKVEIRAPSAIRARPITRYGTLTEAASCKRYARSASGDIWWIASRLVVAALRMSRPPRKGAMAVPRELKACARFSRLEAVFGGPRTGTYGFAATWSAG